ncbi:sigma-70 family RNA polymerase sigma factor [Hyphomonas sp.]|uniref:RNA polymerase sigma factor n=1 Tax=Hyphomonas sp. TaxID=87 RepID=UPI0025BCCE23|nr:sigma-70 family RNA polymerase sigma factor [Hyphomonas sp.]
MADTEHRAPCDPSGVLGAAQAHIGEDLLTDLLAESLPALRAYARKLCGDPTLADDCVQDACVRALSAAASFDTTRPFRPWIFRVLRNEWLQRLRRERRMTTMPGDEMQDMLVDRHTPEDAAESASLLAQIARLPPDMADAIHLVLRLGLSYEEAAEACQCAPGTMKSRVSRARALLIERLDTPPAQKAA